MQKIMRMIMWVLNVPTEYGYNGMYVYEQDARKKAEEVKKYASRVEVAYNKKVDGYVVYAYPRH
jgi:hypothetical protein